MALRVLVQQPVCPPYRVPFFSALARQCELTVLCGTHADDTGQLLSATATPAWLQARRSLRGPFGVHFLRNGAPEVTDYDVVVVNFNPRHFASMRLYLAALRRRVPLVWWGQLWSHTSSKRNLAIRKMLMNRADGIAVYTDREAVVARRLGIGRRVAALGNTCLSRAQLRARRAHLATRARGSRFVLLGRLTDKSGFKEILELAPSFTTRAHFTLVGADAQQMRAYSAAPRPNVRLVEATDEESRKRALLAQADFMIYPGAIGLSAIEALSMGLPVITHGNRRRHGPEHAYLRTGFNAVLTDGSRAGLVQAVDDALSGRLAFATPAKIADAVAALSTDAMAARMAALLHDVAGPR